MGRPYQSNLGFVEIGNFYGHFGRAEKRTQNTTKNHYIRCILFHEAPTKKQLEGQVCAFARKSIRFEKFERTNHFSIFFGDHISLTIFQQHLVDVDKKCL